jgi:hypothetical protein
MKSFLNSFFFVFALRKSAKDDAMDGDPGRVVDAYKPLNSSFLFQFSVWISSYGVKLGL